VEHSGRARSITDPVLAEGGNIEVAESVIAAVAFKEAIEVRGVAKVDGRDRREISDLLGRGECPRGWNRAVKPKDGDVAIEIHIAVFYGMNIPQVARSLRGRVCRVVEDYTGFRVRSLDIVVDGITDLPPEPEEGGGAEASNTP
jgi:uncharacterized alkaline shock family protein YloU